MKTIKFEDCFLTNYHELAKEWNYEKNGLLTPQTVSAGSGKKVWWKCSKGHEWQAKITNRTLLGNGCPYCSNQKVLVGYNDLSTTNPQLAREWNADKNGTLTPQMVVAGSEKKVWWKCSKGHEWQANINRRNSGNSCPICSGRQILAGYNDLATTHPQIAKEWNFEKNEPLTPQKVSSGSHKKIWWRCDKGHEWQAAIYHRVNDGGCPICSGHQVLTGYNDLATTNPTLAQEWNYEKNSGILPTDVSKSSNKIVWWKCKNGHNWQAAINSRNSGNGCPYCSNQKVLAGYNDLATTNPTLAQEWNYERNNGVTPEMVTAGSSKKVWWRCNKGHEWQAYINHRNSNVGCPICANQIVLEGFNDLATTNPQLAREWNADKNGTLTPQMVVAGSERKVWWKCNKGHEWQATITQRNKGLGCPFCSNKKVLRGFNDLATTNPEIAKEWNYDRNGNLTPQMVTAGSNKQVWWKCKNGHEWKTQVNARLQGAGCAKCSSYLKTSFPEQAIFYYVKQVYPDAQNSYKEIFDSRRTIMELDIFIPLIKVAIEYDGLVWHSSERALEREEEKYRICKNQGIILIRIKENVNLGSSACDILISSKYRANYRHFDETLLELSKHITLPHDINLSRDRNKIYAQYLPDYMHNSLFNTNPGLMAEWNYEKNVDISPKIISAKSQVKVWWKCNKGHEWQARIYQRVHGTACPFCTSRKILVGFNDLATTNPQLATEWNHEKNGSLTPQKVSAGSGKKVWWKCSKGHEWQAQICGRKKHSCPVCAKLRKNKN